MSNCHTDIEKSCKCKDPGFISKYCTPRPHNFREWLAHDFFTMFCLGCGAMGIHCTQIIHLEDGWVPDDCASAAHTGCPNLI